MKNTYLISFLLMAIIALPFTLCDAQNPEGERRILILTTNGGGAPPAAHAPSHTDGSDDIQDATAAQKGLATATQITKLDGIETSATADQTSIVGITGTLAQFDTAITDGNFLSDAGDTGTGVYDFGSTTSFEITNAAAPTVDAPGEIAIDTTIAEFSNGVIKFFGSAEEFGGVAMPIAQFTSPTDGHIVSYNAANDEFELVTPNGAFLQIRRTTSLALSPCFGTVSFDATDFETDTSVIQHNDTCTFKVDLKENGSYYVQTAGHANFTSACGASAQYGHRFLLCCVVQDGSNHPTSPIASICNFTFGGAIPGGFFVEVDSAPSVLTFEMDETGGNVNLSAGLTWTVQQK